MYGRFGYKRSHTMQELVFGFLLLAFGAAILFVAVAGGVLTSEQKAVRTLEAAGYTHIQITNRAWFAVGYRGCGRDDAARYTALVVSPAGKPIKVFVCEGILKGGTIRVP